MCCMCVRVCVYVYACVCVPVCVFIYLITTKVHTKKMKKKQFLLIIKLSKLK